MAKEEKTKQKTLFELFDSEFTHLKKKKEEKG
jgi:hypothetical protein